MTQDLQAQLADLQTEADYDAWADEMCRREEEAEDARRCLGEYNGPQGCPCDDDVDPRPFRNVDYGDDDDVWTEADEAAYQADLARIKEEERFDAWYESEGVYREAEDRALAGAYGSPW